MKVNPLLSIIVPIYNIENYIEKCVGSILEQDFDNYEIILVDDGSNDKSPIICDKYEQTSNKVKVIHKKNEGVSAARYDGISLAKGEYTLCIDGDDWIAPNSLNQIAEIITKTNAEIVCFGMYTGSKNGYVSSKFNYRKGIYNRKNIVDEIFPSLIQSEKASYFPPTLCCKVFKTELLKRYMLVNPLATIGEDSATTITCVYNANSLYITQKCFYYYRYNEASTTKSKSAFNWEWPQLAADHIRKNVDMDFGNFKEQMYRKITHDVFSVVASQFYLKMPYKAIIEHINSNLRDKKLYTEAISKCNFKHSARAFLMTLSLRKHLYFLIYIYSKR